MTTLRLADTDPASFDGDAVVVGLAAPRQPGGAPTVTGTVTGTLTGAKGAEGLDEAFAGGLVPILVGLGAKGSAGEITKMPTLGALSAPVLVAVGLGSASAGEHGQQAQASPETYDPEVLRRAAGAALRALAGCRRVGLALPVPDAESVRAVAEGALLGAYAFSRYRHASLDGQRPPVEEVEVLGPASEGFDVAVNRAVRVAQAVNLARDLVNTPPSDLHPEDFAKVATEAATEAGLEVEVLDEAALLAGGYGGILGVGQGSANPPRLVKIRYRPAGEATRHLALVGKGITFDSGGLSLKPAQAMEWMKADMSGAAAVLAAILAVAQLELPVAVTAWAAMAENMPSGTAQRPSDVLTIYGGTTVEVLNTDAEGRLVLADALVAASEERPDLIIDAATLTGAQVVALGSRTGAIMSNDDDVRAHLHDAATRAGEAMWPMPLPEELRKSLDSDIADLSNIGDKYGGMLVAGLFLREFVGEGLPWVHLDIAGPSFQEGEPFGYTPKGGTGAAVRTLVQVAEDLAQGRY